jgi:hypothetical protein
MWKGKSLEVMRWETRRDLRKVKLMDTSKEDE